LASRLSPEAYLHEPTILGILSEDFWEIVTRYEGIPTALFEHQELREFYEPILRADFEALSKYNNSHQPKVQLPISAHVLVGKNDSRNITLHTAQTWSHHFTKEVLYKKFDGGHFFVYDNENVAKYIKEMICI
jgi:surfactin synthase thioesterase subunit